MLDIALYLLNNILELYFQECILDYDRMSVASSWVSAYGNRKVYFMTEKQIYWSRKRDELVTAIKQLGFPRELGEQIAKQLGSPKAMDRMLAYIYNVKPQTAELIVDEMLAICSDIDTWHKKKSAEEANAKYNEILYYGLETDDEENY